MADKKISQLPKINSISGSEVILPIVHDGTTQKMDVSTFSVFASQWSATTGSNTFIGNQTITGNATIGGTLVVAGKLTAQEFFTEITSASVIFESGSSIFGNSADDTHTFTGTININDNVVGNAPLDFTSQSLNIQTGSQDLVNLRISSTTGSINTTTSSFDSVFLGISSVTGAINTTTSSFDSVFLGISSFTGSLNSLTGSYATTGSNTFRGNQIITGSLSISAGEFNVTTGSGNMTSSLIFDHTQNDGVALQLRHNDRLSVADHTFNVNVWAAGVYTTFVRNGTPYSILNVEAFDDNKIYLYRDTRLYNKSLVIDNNLTVQKDVVIGTGSLDINNGEFSITSGSGELTSSLSFTHTTVDPITGNATLALRYRNNDVGPENNAWRFVADDGGVKLSYDQYATSNKLLFSVSSLGSNFDKLLIWRDARLYGKGLTVDDSLLVKGVITGSLLATNGVVSSSNQLFELNQQTGSQDNLNAQIGISTSSLNFTTGALNLFTGSVIGQTNTISTFTASVNFTTQSLNIQTGSQESINTTLSIVTGSMRAEIGGIEAYTASLKDAIIVNGTNVRIVGELTASRIYTEFITSSVLFVTGSNIIGDQSTDKHEFTGSVNLKNGLFVEDYSKFGKSGLDKALDVFGRIAVTGSVTTQANSIGGFIGNFYTQWDSFGSQGGDGNASVGYFVGTQNDDRKLRLTSDSDIQLNHGYNKKIQITRNFISDARVELTGSLLATGSSAIIGNLAVTLGGITGSVLATNGVLSGSSQISELTQIPGIMALTASMKAAAIVSSSQQITNYNLFAVTASANTFYGNQKIKGNLDIDNKVSVTGSLIVSSSANQLWATPEFQLYNGLGTVNFALTPNTGNQFTIQAYGTKAEILQANEPLRLLSPELQFVKYDNSPTLVSITGSVDVKSGGIKVRGNLDIDNKVSVTGSLIVSSSTNQLWATPEFQLYNGLGTVNFALTPNTGNQFTIQAYGTKAEILQANEPLRLLSPTLQFVKYDNTPTKVEITGSLAVSGSLRTNIISGGLDVNGGITGSVRGNLAGVADYAATIAIANTGTTTDTSLFPAFTSAPVLGSYSYLYSHASSSFFLNGVTRRVHMEGFVVSGSNNIAEISGSFNVSGSTNLTGSVTVNQSRIDDGWTAYTPEWTAASVNPVINNGTIEGYYKVIGKTCFVRGNIAMGSTTTFGTGEWYVSMPFTASHADGILMTATLLDNGSGWYNATMAGARAGFNHKAPIQYQSAGGTANDINPTQPFTWASTDRFIWNGSYEIA